MARPKTIASIFKAASLIEDDGVRINFIRQNFNPLMRDIIQGAYHPNVVWNLPKGLPAYTQAGPHDENEGKLYQEQKRLHYFCKGDPQGDLLDDKKRFKMFIQLLESLAPDEAELLVYVKDKQIPYPHLSYDFFRQCFGDDILPASQELPIPTPPLPVVVPAGAMVTEAPKFSTVAIQPHPAEQYNPTNAIHATIKEEVKPVNKGNSFHHWITNETESKMVSKDLPIPEGWRKGRAVKWNIFKKKEENADLLL